MNNGNEMGTCKHHVCQTHRSECRFNAKVNIDMHIRSTAQEINNRITSQGLLRAEVVHFAKERQIKANFCNFFPE